MKKSEAMEEKFGTLLAQIRDEHLEALNLFSSKLGEERIGELVKELKGNKSVKRVLFSCCNLGPRFANVLSDVLMVNETVLTVDLFANKLGDEGAVAIGEALKMNQSVKELFIGSNNFGPEGSRALLNALQVNGSLIFCSMECSFANEANACCYRNKAMHNRARESVVCFLALRRTGRIVWIPREMMVMIAVALWRTKSDVDAWKNMLCKK